jgi:integrase
MEQMEQIQVRSLSEAIKILKLGRATFYRYTEQGKLSVERVYTENGLIYNIYKSPSQPKAAFSEKGALNSGGVAMVTQPNLTRQETSQSVSHAQFLDEWIAWKDEGVGTKAWSTSHKKKCLRYVGHFFKTYKQVSAENLEQFLIETPVLQWALRRAKHSAVSSYAKFLYRKKKLVSRNEYYEIRGLYPKKPKDYKRDIKLIHGEHIPAILESIQALYSSDAHKVSLLTNLVIFLSETGLRISEAGAITLDNLFFHEDPEQAYVYLPEYITKNGKERYVPFSPEAQQAIRAFLRIRPKDVAFDQVFLFNHRVWGYTTIKATSIGHIFEDVSEHCQVPFTAHSFRHYRITTWANDPNISITDV